MSSSPAQKAAAVTPSDSADLPGGWCRALFCGSGGTIVLQSADPSPQRTDLTFTNLSPGQILPVNVARVKATGTTATGIIALY